MNERFKKLTRDLSNELQKHSFSFMIEHLNNEEETTDLINLVLSSHVSSLINCMNEIASSHEEHTKNVQKFISELTKFISDREQIKEVETI